MADDLTPYLDINAFSGMLLPRVLNDGEAALATQLLLPAAAITIRNAFIGAGLTPPLVADVMAKLVTFELVREALSVPNEFTGHLSYQRSTDDRMEAGTLTAVANLLDFTEHHRQMLGLSAAAAPTYGGMDGNWGDPFHELPGGYRGYFPDGSRIGVVAIGVEP